MNIAFVLSVVPSLLRVFAATFPPAEKTDASNPNESWTKKNTDHRELK
jgi:hypothetical protein